MLVGPARPYPKPVETRPVPGPEKLLDVAPGLQGLLRLLDHRLPRLVALAPDPVLRVPVQVVEAVALSESRPRPRPEFPDLPMSFSRALDGLLLRVTPDN